MNRLVIVVVCVFKLYFFFKLFDSTDFFFGGGGGGEPTFWETMWLIDHSEEGVYALVVRGLVGDHRYVPWGKI